MWWLRNALIAAVVLVACGGRAEAQITPTFTFSPATTISSSEVNANFALLANALNRTGGTITGNITVSAGVTIDGIDLSAWLNQAVLSTSSPTFAALTLTSTLSVAGNVAVNTDKFTVTAASGNTTIAGALGVSGAADFNSSADFGSGNVALIGSDGKINGPLSSTILDDLDGTALTGLAKLASTNTFTARNDFKTYTETKATANPSAGAITYDLSAGTHFETALTGDATVTISNVPNPANGVVAFTVKFTADGTLRDFTWPASVVWPGGAEPTFTQTNNKRDVITFISWDAGTTWLGFVGGQAF